MKWWVILVAAPALLLFAYGVLCLLLALILKVADLVYDLEDWRWRKLEADEGIFETFTLWIGRWPKGIRRWWGYFHTPSDRYY